MQNSMQQQTGTPNLAPERKRFSRIGWSILLMLAVTTAFQLAVVLLASASLKLSIASNSWLRYALLTFPQYLIAMPLAALLIRGPVDPLPSKKLSAGQFLALFCIAYFAMFVGNVIGRIVTMIISVLANSNMTSAVSELVTHSDVLANFVVIVLIGPFAEELFFRKLVAGRLHQYGDRVAILVSALLFGLAHGNFSQCFYAFSFGLVLGYVYVKTGKIAYTIALHMSINLLGSIIAPAISASGGPLMLAYSLALLGISIAGLVLFILNRKKIVLKQGSVILPSWKPVFLNTGMLAFFIICTVMFAINTISSLA